MLKGSTDVGIIPEKTKVREILDKHGIGAYRLCKHAGSVPSQFTGTWQLKINGKRKLTKKELLLTLDLINKVAAPHHKYSATDLGFEIVHVKFV